MAEWSKAVDLSSILRCRRGFEPHSRHLFFSLSWSVTKNDLFKKDLLLSLQLTVAQLVERGTVNVFSGNP